MHWPGLLRQPWTWLVLVAGLLGLALLSQSIVTTLAATDGPPRELIVLSGDDESAGGPRQVLLDLWNAAHPDTPARFRSAGATADAQYSEMKRWVSPENAGNPNFDVDVLNLDVPWMQDFIEQRAIVPLDTASLPGDLAANLLDNPRGTCVDDQGRWWALPFNADAGLLYYWKKPLDLDPSQELPGRPSWADIAKRARTALARPGSDLAGGYTAQLASYEGLTVNVLEAVWAAEQPGESDNDLGLSTNPATWERAVKNLYADEVLPDSVNFEEVDSTAAFKARRVVFMRNWPLAYHSLLTEDERLTLDRANADIGVTMLPGPSVLGGQNLAVAAKSRQPAAAQRLIQFLTSRPAQRLLMQLGGFAPTLRDIYDDPEIKRMYPHALTIRDAVEKARPRPPARNYQFFSATVRDIVADVREGGAVPPDLEGRLRDALAGRYPPSPAPS